MQWVSEEAGSTDRTEGQIIRPTSRGTRWEEIISVSDLYEIQDNNFNYYH